MLVTMNLIILLFDLILNFLSQHMCNCLYLEKYDYSGERNILKEILISIVRLSKCRFNEKRQTGGDVCL